MYPWLDYLAGNTAYIRNTGVRQMKKLILSIIMVFALATASGAAVLVMSANGTFTEKPTLATAATSYDCAGKTIIVTSALTAVQSNISSASVNSWPTDRT